MRCDVVAVGTELLLGQIVDTNSAWIGEQLALSGIDSLLQVKVGDNVGRMIEVLRRVLEDADAVIVCGGLGPTHDDLTRDAIATTSQRTGQRPACVSSCTPGRVCARHMYCTALTTASTTAIHSSDFHSHCASRAVSGAMANPTESCCVSVLILAILLAGMLTPFEPTNVR